MKMVMISPRCLPRVLLMALMLFQIILALQLYSVTEALQIRRNLFSFSKTSYKTSSIPNTRLSRQRGVLYFKVTESDTRSKAILDVDEDESDDDDQDDGTSATEFLLKISKGIIPLAASVGFAVTPSPLIAMRIAGAAAGGIAGLLARTVLNRRLKETIESLDRDRDRGDISLPPGVTDVLKDLQNNIPPPGSLSMQGLEMLAKKKKVPAKDLTLLFTHVYAEVIFAAVQPDNMDLLELTEVLDFADTMKLTPAEIGNGFALAAYMIGKQLEKDDRGFFTVDFDPNILRQAAKVFFLADKMIGTNEGYYGKRMQVALAYFLPDSYKEIITDACTRLFRRCVESVLSSPDDITAEEVAKLKSFLSTSAETSSLRPSSMQNLIMEAFQFSLDSALDRSSQSAMEVNLWNFERYQKARVILGWNERELTATVETKTLPIFEDIVKELMTKVVEKPAAADELSESLDERIRALNVDVRKARVFLTSEISRLNADYMNKIDRVYNASGGAVEPAFKIMISYAHTHDALSKFARKVMDGVDLPIPGLPFTDMVKVNMYEMQINRAGQNTPDVVNEMFDLNEAQRKLVRKTLALPKVASWVTTCIQQSNFAAGAKEAYRKQLDEYGVSQEEWQATSADFYYRELQNVAQARAVPSLADMERMKLIKDFLDCPDEAVAKISLELLGDKYVKALTESMTPTGVVTEEYLDGLNRLRVRLGLSEFDSRKLLGVATRQRIGPIVKDLIDIWKSDTDANYRREKEKKEKKDQGENVRDKSRDPISSPDNVFGFMEMGGQKTGGGPNVFMREALNLVDCVVSNYEMQGLSLTDQTPITVVGVAPVEDLAGMVKHYLITRLAEQDPELRARYIENENKFAKIVGCSLNDLTKLKESLAFTAFSNLLKSVLTYKDAVDSKDIQQFALLKDSLQLSQESSEKIYQEACKVAVQESAKAFLKPKEDALITAEMAQRFRGQVQSLSLNMLTDVGFSEKLVTFLFALEVQYLIENSRESELPEVQQAYDIPEERAQEIVEACCKRYISQLLNLALRAAKKYDEGDAAKWLREIVKYSVFVSDGATVDADGNVFSEKDKSRLLSFFLSEFSPSDGAESYEDKAEDVAAVAAKLREMINLTESYQAPLQGIEGLLGNVKSLSQLGKDGDNKKPGEKRPWAWG